jgi:hypothetical protein
MLRTGRTGDAPDLQYGEELTMQRMEWMGD